MAGELGYELHGPSKHGREVYQAILDAGQKYGIRRLGSRTQQVNHVEACFPTSSVDYIPAMYEPEESGYFEELSKSNYRLTRETIANPGSFELSANSDMYRSPVELGWAKNIKFDHEFLGRAALEQEIADPSRTIRTLEWNADDVIEVFASFFAGGELPPFMEMPRDYSDRGMWADAVFVRDRLVGVSTSRCYSVFFRKMISLCVLDVGHAE